MASEIENSAIAQCYDFLVKRSDLSKTQFVISDVVTAELQQGQILLRVDKFAFTANNISYAVLGDRMAYWKFFPATSAEWGRLPVWGFAAAIVAIDLVMRKKEAEQKELAAPSDGE